MRPGKTAASGDATPDGRLHFKLPAFLPDLHGTGIYAEFSAGAFAHRAQQIVRLRRCKSAKFAAEAALTEIQVLTDPLVTVERKIAALQELLFLQDCVSIQNETYRAVRLAHKVIAFPLEMDDRGRANMYSTLVGALHVKARQRDWYAVIRDAARVLAIADGLAFPWDSVFLCDLCRVVSAVVSGPKAPPSPYQDASSSLDTDDGDENLLGLMVLLDQILQNGLSPFHAISVPQHSWSYRNDPEDGIIQGRKPLVVSAAHEKQISLCISSLLDWFDVHRAPTLLQQSSSSGDALLVAHHLRQKYSGVAYRGRSVAKQTHDRHHTDTDLRVLSREDILGLLHPDHVKGWFGKFHAIRLFGSLMDQPAVPANTVRMLLEWYKSILDWSLEISPQWRKAWLGWAAHCGLLSSHDIPTLIQLLARRGIVAENNGIPRSSKERKRKRVGQDLPPEYRWVNVFAASEASVTPRMSLQTKVKYLEVLPALAGRRRRAPPLPFALSSFWADVSVQAMRVSLSGWRRLLQAYSRHARVSRLPPSVIRGLETRVRVETDRLDSRSALSQEHAGRNNGVTSDIDNQDAPADAPVGPSASAANASIAADEALNVHMKICNLAFVYSWLVTRNETRVHMNLSKQTIERFRRSIAYVIQAALTMAAAESTGGAAAWSELHARRRFSMLGLANEALHDFANRKRTLVENLSFAVYHGLHAMTQMNVRFAFPELASGYSALWLIFPLCNEFGALRMLRFFKWVRFVPPATLQSQLCALLRERVHSFTPGEKESAYSSISSQDAHVRMIASIMYHAGFLRVKLDRSTIDAVTERMTEHTQLLSAGRRQHQHGRRQVEAFVTPLVWFHFALAMLNSSIADGFRPLLVEYLSQSAPLLNAWDLEMLHLSRKVAEPGFPERVLTKLESAVLAQCASDCSSIHAHQVPTLLAWDSDVTSEVWQAAQELFRDHESALLTRDKYFAAGSCRVPIHIYLELEDGSAAELFIFVDRMRKHLRVLEDHNKCVLGQPELDGFSVLQRSQLERENGNMRARVVSILNYHWMQQIKHHDPVHVFQGLIAPFLSAE
ncbi:hypothetical protein FVE85_1317 [Porphyridium purpureum]|uniref:Uncharacterized protein n=1 Tax=Porphyridium purpureum TaxID=35688 RepID=A0A5J4YJ49_PORPP|nr:hypothetical protein FVE85_1317 [Porphyridium purpureum]|eukprot:POR5291..scf251_18